MEKYKLVEKLGGGTYGSVAMARNIQSNEVVAIKTLQEPVNNWTKCVEMAEVKTLAKLSHPNIIKLIEVIKHQNKLHLVFEYMEQNILDLLRKKSGRLAELEIRNIVFQVLQGLYYMHRQGLMHRDMKPENLLEFKGTVKIADFGLVKSASAQPPFTEYISTRWYRAPELLLSSSEYDCKIDIFALGAIMAELYTGNALFNGENATQQVSKILNILGTPTPLEWEEGYKLARKLKLTFPSYKKQNLASCIPNANEDAIDLMSNPNF